MKKAIGFPLPNSVQLDNSRLLSLLQSCYIYDVECYAYYLIEVKNYQQTGSISAYYWKNGRLNQCVIDMPMYNEVFYSSSSLIKEQREAYVWLCRNTKITDFHALSKIRLQQELLISDLSEYVIPSFLISSYAELCSSLASMPNVFIKPVHGRKAKGVMHVFKEKARVMYAVPEYTGELTEAVFGDYYNEVCLNGGALILQPYINICTTEGKAVDFRCVVSLNGSGQWENVLTYARIGGSCVASNVSHGGSVAFPKPVIESMLGEDCADAKLKEIEQTAVSVAAFIESKCENPVSFLGIDICVDWRSANVYVIEANSKPGAKLVGPWPLCLMRAQYFSFLLSHA